MVLWILLNASTLRRRRIAPTVVPLRHFTRTWSTIRVVMLFAVNFHRLCLPCHPPTRRLWSKSPTGLSPFLVLLQPVTCSAFVMCRKKLVQKAGIPAQVKIAAVTRPRLKVLLWRRVAFIFTFPLPHCDNFPPWIVVRLQSPFLF